MIQTVLGPVAASELGRVDSHEHVLSDASGLSRPGLEPTPADRRVVIQNLGYLRWNMLGLPDNLRLDQAEIAIDELIVARTSGTGTVIDGTSYGLGPNHAALPEISRRAGIHIVCAFGTYVPSVLPEWVRELDEAALEALFSTALDDAIPGVDFRAGILGIMGTTGTVTDEERMRLRAAARAAARSGAAVSVRLDEDERAGGEVVELLAAEGLPADRVLFTNADEYLDAAYWHELSATGATLEMCFGTEDSHLGRVVSPSDLQRLDFFTAIVDELPDARLVLGGSLWTKAQLASYGGPGLGHLGNRIVPELLRRGVDPQRIESMLVTEPARLLDRP